MNICYIISTCDNYLDTRVRYQMNTFLKNVDRNDIYYLTSKSNIEERQFGWNCLDDKKYIIWKYIHFIYNMTTILDYDWYIFIHDDTFVFKNKLDYYLSQYDCNICYYIGHKCEDINLELSPYLSSGSGYAISNKLYKEIHSYVRWNGINNVYKNSFFDLCISMWIDELKKNININFVHNQNFLISHFTDVEELKDAITAHKISTLEENEYCYNLTKKDTTFVIVTNSNYFIKAKRTIIDLRSKGNWKGDIVIVTIDFKLTNNFKKFYNVQEVQFKPIYKSEKIEINDLNQWDKFHVFDNYFTQWKRVVFLEAGLRVFDDVIYLLELDYKGKILAPKDGKFYENQKFNCQVSYENESMIEKIKSEFRENILDETYFLDCIFIYDTDILKLFDKKQIIDIINKYTLCIKNEMGIMNLLLRFKYNLWEPFPFKISSGKILFDWSESNNPNTYWTDYCFIKSPLTISDDDC
jgi:hypothetical protein